jgi:hypothetical protein
MKFVAYMAVSLITFFYILLVLFIIIVYTVVCSVRFCLILQIMYSDWFVMYSFVLFTDSCCYVCSVLYILFSLFCFCVLFVCKCVL